MGKPIAKSAFTEMDKDADGKITCAEFTTACLSQEKLSKDLEDSSKVVRASADEIAEKDIEEEKKGDNFFIN